MPINFVMQGTCLFSDILRPALTCWVILNAFCLKFKEKLFKTIFQENHLNVKQFESRSAATFVEPGFKLFTKVISNQNVFVYVDSLRPSQQFFSHSIMSGRVFLG